MGWGFWAHKRINHMAVFTLPPDMLGLYKKHLDYLTEHAVDPDKRRYAVEGEEFRHYIDIDHWGSNPFESVPRYWGDVLVKYADMYAITQAGDTFSIGGGEALVEHEGVWWLKGKDLPAFIQADSLKLDYDVFRRMALDLYPPYNTSMEWELPLDSAAVLWPEVSALSSLNKIYVQDGFTKYGILPFHLPRTLRRLSKAFRDKNLTQIIRISADLGHYIGDAHVPLHTTENYNGQMTGQRGIHGFWESRLPELYAEGYDYYVGRAYYIDDIQSEIWQTVYESHMALDSVLTFEQELNETFPEDKKYSYESRNNVVVRNYSRPYSQVYHERLDGQVERRLRKSIQRLGAFWYTAWKNAGSPDLSDLMKESLDLKGKEYKRKLKIKDRESSGFGMNMLNTKAHYCCSPMNNLEPGIRNSKPLPYYKSNNSLGFCKPLFRQVLSDEVFPENIIDPQIYGSAREGLFYLRTQVNGNPLYSLARTAVYRFDNVGSSHISLYHNINCGEAISSVIRMSREEFRIGNNLQQQPTRPRDERKPIVQLIIHPKLNTRLWRLNNPIIDLVNQDT